MSWSSARDRAARLPRTSPRKPGFRPCCLKNDKRSDRRCVARKASDTINLRNSSNPIRNGSLPKSANSKSRRARTARRKPGTRAADAATSSNAASLIACWQNARQRPDAEVRVKTSVTGVVMENGRVRGVKIRRGDFFGGAGEMEIESQIVIAADGVEAQVGRWAGLDTQLPLNDTMACAQYFARGD